jgi:hypothetical protein
MKRNAAIEEALKKKPYDLELHEEYASWLDTQGEERARLIWYDLERFHGRAVKSPETTKEIAQIRATVGALVESVAGIGRSSWHLGFLRGIAIRRPQELKRGNSDLSLKELLQELFEDPSCFLLNTLILEQGNSSFFEALRTSHVPPTLTRWRFISSPTLEVQRLRDLGHRVESLILGDELCERFTSRIWPDLTELKLILHTSEFTDILPRLSRCAPRLQVLHLSGISNTDELEVFAKTELIHSLREVRIGFRKYFKDGWLNDPDTARLTNCLYQHARGGLGSIRHILLETPLREPFIAPQIIHVGHLLGFDELIIGARE